MTTFSKHMHFATIIVSRGGSRIPDGKGSQPSQNLHEIQIKKMPIVVLRLNGDI